MTPSLYDLLDVDATASEEEIRAAWKAAIADLDPTDRRFRAYNDAAATLLDPDRRARHDAELAADRDPDEVAEEAEEAEEAAATEGGEPAAGGPAAEESAAEESAAEESAGSAVPTRFATPPGRLLLLGVAVAAVVALVLAAWSATWESTFADTPKDAEQLAEDRESALVAADRIAADALSYDYREMDEASIAEKQEVMAPSYAEEYAQVIEALRPEAEAQQTVVTIVVRGTALAALSPDGNQARVVVFADQAVERAGRAGDSLRQTATLRLIRDAEGGSWLLEQVCTQDLECDPGDQGGSADPEVTPSEDATTGESTDQPTEESTDQPTEESTGESTGAPTEESSEAPETE